MNTANLQLSLESDGVTYPERCRICRAALTSGDMPKAYKAMAVVLQKLIKNSPHLFDRNDCQADVQAAAVTIAVDRLCEEMRFDDEHAAAALTQQAGQASAPTSAPTSAPVQRDAVTTTKALPSRKVADDVLNVLRRARLENGKVYLPDQALDRKLYTSTRDVLAAMGGKWTSGKTQAFVFAEADPASFEVAFTGLLDSGSYTDPKDMSFFPTPLALAAELVALSGLKPGMTVLEPSAGRGSIAQQAALIVGHQNVKCIELYPPNARALERAGFAVIEDDFLTMQPPLLEADKFDVILLNPPFSNHQDAAHVAHACRFVKSTGCVAAITSTSWTSQDNNRKAAEFRSFTEQVGAIVEQVPAGTFKTSGTMVPTQILVIEGANLPWYQAARHQLADKQTNAEGVENNQDAENAEDAVATESPSF